MRPGEQRTENREQSVQAQSAKPSTATENRPRDKRATNKPMAIARHLRPSPARALLHLLNLLHLLCGLRVSHGTSQTCLRVQGVFPPAGAWGSAPHPPINQSAKSFVSFVIPNYSGSPACGSTP